MPDRYYSAEPIDGRLVTLQGKEAHHLLHVMRAQPGLAVVVFDGRGGEFAAEVVRCQRSTVELSVGDRIAVERELAKELTLAVSLPKGDRQRWLIEKSVELGVSRLIPLQAARTVGKGDSGTKLARYVIEASKQCGRNRLMEITAPVSWPSFLAETTLGQRLIAHPGGKPLVEIDIPADDGVSLEQVTKKRGDSPRENRGEPCSATRWNHHAFSKFSVNLAVGPEGGFTDAEVSQALAAGWQSVDLGERILRIETAAVALVSALVLNTK